VRSTLSPREGYSFLGTLKYRLQRRKSGLGRKQQELGENYMREGDPICVPHTVLLG
jgi:hypothetical protein